MTASQNEIAHTIPSYLSVNQFIAKHTVFTLGGMRSLVFQEHQNGLAKCGAVVRIGSKVMIDENKFFGWVASQNKAVA